MLWLTSVFGKVPSDLPEADWLAAHVNVTAAQIRMDAGFHGRSFGMSTPQAQRTTILARETVLCAGTSVRRGGIRQHDALRPPNPHHRDRTAAPFRPATKNRVSCNFFCNRCQSPAGSSFASNFIGLAADAHSIHVRREREFLPGGVEWASDGRHAMGYTRKVIYIPVTKMSRHHCDQFCWKIEDIEARQKRLHAELKKWFID